MGAGSCSRMMGVRGPGKGSRLPSDSFIHGHQCETHTGLPADDRDRHAMGGRTGASPGPEGVYPNRGPFVAMENSCLDRQNLTSTQTMPFSQTCSAFIP